MGWGPVGIEKTISVQKVFSKSSFLWSMLPEKQHHTSGFHKKVFMKRPSVHPRTFLTPPCFLQLFEINTLRFEVRSENLTGFAGTADF